ncbi:epidermal growth factor receptor substrate 15-like 1 isoform X3 [Myotis yumanensis]|uniref:epidermal growth factor receptor substrate 15-like 1 isoform X3 n=1 Tax=Myotis yumanensis TaxID=159337 RepID=UPI0038CFAC76
MAAPLLPLAQQIPTGNPLYESYYKQVDPAYTGRVGASEAALFLKKSGLSDIILGKIWDLADPEGKGFLDKQGFYVALRLVACAQSGHEVTLSNLNLNMPPPKFHDTSSPLMVTPPSTEALWAVRVEEKAKFDGIFESLLPINGLLSGDKVKPVLMNSKLPLDVLGRVWDLSDIDKDGHLDRDEFAVAMHLVYRALEKEPVPSVLPPSLIPPTKRKKTVFPGAVPVLPASPPPKDSLRSTPSHGSVSSLNSTGSLSPKHSIKQTQPTVNWVVPVADKMRFDEIFLKTDLDLDGYVSGQEVKEIFMHSGLNQNLLAHIWALADTRQTGKLSKDQFALAMYFIQQKVSKGIDPPQVLSPDMVPPSERGTPIPDSSSSLGSGEFTGVKELDDISQEIAQLQREKYTLEQDIREKEEAIRQKTNEVQELQNDLDRETSSLQELEAQKQDAQDRLDEMDQQKAKLRDMLSDVRQKCQDETQMISSLKTQIQSQESDLKSQEDDLNRAKSELNRLQQEETQLEQSIQAGKVQLETIIKSLKSTQDEINQARSKLAQLHESQQEAHRSLEQYDEDDPFKNKALLFSNNAQELHPDPFQAEDPFKSDPFKGADPFKGDPFQNDPFAEQQIASTDPFGGDPFKESDPFRGSAPDDFFKKHTKNDPFSSDPFTKNPSLPSKLDPFESSDPFSSSSVSSRGSGHFGTLDPFGSGSFNSAEGFADFSQMSKTAVDQGYLKMWKAKSPHLLVLSPRPLEGQDSPMTPLKVNRTLPLCLRRNLLLHGLNRPAKRWLNRKAVHCIRYWVVGKSTPVSQLGSADFPDSPDPFQPLGADSSDPFQNKRGFGDPFSGKDPFAPSSSAKPSKASSLGFADFTSFGNEEQQLAWAKRESEKAEQERLARLRRQEQEDLELAIALSKADMPA